MLIVMTTYPELKSAKESAKNLIQKKLAACINIIKVEQSVYRWKGKLVEEGEYLLIIKTNDKTYVRLEREIKKDHPYEICEILAWKAEKGNKKYLDWAKRACLGV